jgi:DNA-binding GntR family transcriptional regulator
MQDPASFIERPNLSDSLVVRLRNWIADGQVPAGKRVNEVHLAASLGVSRTPLREALGRLATEGALTTVPRLGFFVRSLTLDEFQQIYGIRPLLDPEALRLAGIPPAKCIDRLDALNREIGEAADPNRVITLDDAWHLELLAGCPNRVLVGLIEQFMRRTRRYEIALVRECGHAGVSIAEHGQVTAGLRARDLVAACDALRRNLQSGFEPVAAWLRGREDGSKPAKRTTY